VRFGRGYRGGEGRSPPLVCGICGSLPDAVSCEPLLVSGEVIGSILVNHPDPPADEAHQRIRESVTQAAPVLANLRNLALAELRAATDALTGLPTTGPSGHHQAHGGPGVAQRLAAVGGPARPGPLQAEIAQPVTASRGIAAIPDDAGDADTLIRAADRPLYAAKANGRNRPELFISPARSARTPA
jgi:hypothetical protein